MPTGPDAVAYDRVAVDADQPARVADADALGDVMRDGHDLPWRQAGVKERGALAFGEAGFAGAATEQAALVRPIMPGDREITVVAFAVVGAVGILTAEAGEVVHDSPPWHEENGTRSKRQFRLQKSN